MKSFVDGDVISAVVRFLAQDRTTPVDPATIIFMCAIGNTPVQTVPYGSATTPASGVVARDSMGVYEFWLDTTGQPGMYKIQAKGTGNGQATTPVAFFNVATRLA